jgi:UDP-N-acetylmuramyl pentapeptide phosphotransferase/UDP-N-acetylglucosamine-1-phosphate transferase
MNAEYAEYAEHVRRAARHRSTPRALAGAVLAGAAARAAYRRLRERPPGGAARWERENHRGETVTLLEGPALAAGAAVATLLMPGLPRGVRIAGAGATLAAGALGAYDDLRGSAAAKGLRGHLRALRRGEVTTGAVKLAGIGATGLAAGCALRRGAVDRALAAVVVAGAANAVNLFDLRPGRAAKAALIAGAPGVLRGRPAAAAALGAAVALLPEDLAERAMLGDAGANALGAALGVAAVADASRGRLVVLALGLAGLTAASEKVSFTKVIAGQPALRYVDSWGRRRVDERVGM